MKALKLCDVQIMFDIKLTLVKVLTANMLSERVYFQFYLLGMRPALLLKTWSSRFLNSRYFVKESFVDKASDFPNDGEE